MASYLLDDRISDYETDDLVHILNSQELTPDARDIVRKELEKRGDPDELIMRSGKLRLQKESEPTDSLDPELLELEKSSARWRKVCMVTCFLSGLGFAYGIAKGFQDLNSIDPSQLVIAVSLLLGAVVAFYGIATRNIVGPALLAALHLTVATRSSLEFGVRSSLIFWIFAICGDLMLLSLYLKVAKVEKQREMRERTRAIVDSPLVEAGPDIV